MNDKWGLGLSCVLMAACAAETGIAEDEDVAAESQAIAGPNGKKLFEKETFDGNGRTCATCHGKETGSVSPEEAQERFDDDPDDPLFRPIDSDDGVGNSYTRLLTDATIRVTL